MKTLTKILALVFAIGIVAVGCKPDQTVNPNGKGNTPDASLSTEDPNHNRPDPQCMSSVFSDLQDNQGNLAGGDPFEGTYGEFGRVEIVNDPYNVMVLLSMGFHWLAADGSIFVGQCNQVPLNTDGSVNWEQFAWGSNVPVVQYFQWSIPNASIQLDAAGCACVVVALEGVQTDFFGAPYNNIRLWAKGDRTVGTNGRAITACPVACPFLSHGTCYDVNPAAGRTSATLSVTSTTAGTPGAAPFTFTWYNSSNTPIATEVNNTGTSSHTVTTTTGGTWYVSVSNSMSIYTDRDTINVGVNTCGAPPCGVHHPSDVASIPASMDCTPGNSPHHKVNVCHLPPGNPGNRHTICIDTDALPAHVIDFKPANNRCMGHLSGCHIGPCDPCGGTVSDSETEVARAAAYKQQFGCN
jgi:hypothetical protein